VKLEIVLRGGIMKKISYKVFKGFNEMKLLILHPHTFSHTISFPSLFLSLPPPQALILYLSHIHFFLPAT